nr:uncharacterized protein LOC109777685 [Aegilops tauschii subsp. strangulata]
MEEFCYLSLKHKRQEFTVVNLIGTLDVEEKARAKDTRARFHEGNSSANLVQKRNFQTHKPKNKNYAGKGKFDGKYKAPQPVNFKKKKGTYKKKGKCHLCGSEEHWASSCKDRWDMRQNENNSKTANVVIGDVDMKDVGSQELHPC